MNLTEDRQYLRTIADRLEHYSMPEPTSGCLLWLRNANRHGYGMVWDGRAKRLAHVVAWEHANGRPVPPGLCVLHKCDVTYCIEPNHLFTGTMADNTADMRRKGRGFDIPPHHGENHGASKLTDEAVQAIRRDPRILRLIAADYDVHLSLIWLVKNRRAWKHIP